MSLQQETYDEAEPQEEEEETKLLNAEQVTRYELFCCRS